MEALQLQRDGSYIQLSYLQRTAVQSRPWPNRDPCHVIKTQRPSVRLSESQLERRLKDNAPFPLAALVSAGGPRPSERARPLQRGHTVINLQDGITRTVER